MPIKGLDFDYNFKAGIVMSAQTNAALSSYSDYGYNTEIDYADPHRLIQMLFEGALKRIAFAKGAMQRKQIAEKGNYISQTIDIVGGLRASLDMKNGGEIAANLESLYEYITHQLLAANLNNSIEILDEVSGLLRDVKVAWDAINAPAATMEKKEIEFEKPVNNVEIKQTPVNIPVKVNKPVQTVNARANKALKAYAS